MTRRSTIKGAASFRRMLKLLPDSANAELRAFLNNAGPVLAAQMKSQLPVLASPRPNRTPGALRDSITWKVTPKALNLKVGEISKRDVLFYGHILDVGRKAKTVNVTRRKNTAPYSLTVSPLTGLYVLKRTRVSFLNGTLPGYREIMDKILLAASQGAGND